MCILLLRQSMKDDSLSEVRQVYHPNKSGTPSLDPLAFVKLRGDGSNDLVEDGANVVSRTL
jgi:hypothetical protein